VGTQYASVIFAHTVEQRATAEARVAKLQALLDSAAVKGLAGGRVATQVRDATQFYAAGEEHQRYLALNPRGYCNHMRRFEWPQQC
jgi:peptide-methionine (S)-S-oxide reductase